MSDKNQPLNSFLDSLQSSLQDVAGGVTKKRKITPEETQHPVTFGFTDINKYEYSARTLQKHIRQIISGAPTTEELERIADDKSVDEIVRQEVKSNSSLQMVAQLKSLYNAKKLPLFDEILANNVQEGKASTTGRVSTVSSKSNESGDGGGKKVGSKAREAGLPSLPKIKDPQLRARVFQHKSLATHKTYLDQSEIVLAHNERVEFLGDSVLNTMVTYILYERFPNSPEGQLSQIRALLVNNRTLAEFSLKYGFDKELRCNIDVSALGIGNQKIYADIFEAYLGALAMERGYDLLEVQNWLAKLMEPQLMKFEIENKKTPPINKDAKTELYSLVGTASTHPVYKITKSGNGSRNPFKVQCVIGDEVLGEGMAPNFRDAGLRAAMAALENKELLEKFGRQRLETDRSDSVKKSEGSSKGTANGISLPFVADHTIFPSKIARNEVYSHLGKTYGISPEYHVEFEEKKKRYKAELLIGQKVVAVAYDASKKHAMNRAAMLILNNQDSLHDIIGMVL